MKLLTRFACLALIAGLLLAPAGVEGQEKDKEKDIFNYAAQKSAPKDVKRIVFVADPGTHGAKGNHEFYPGAMYMARRLNAAYPNVYATVYSSKQWPKDLSDADAIIVLLNHGGSAVNPAVKAAVERGAGFMAVHYGVEVNKGAQGEQFLKWMGGYFEPFWSVNPHWKPKFDKIPEHEVTRGVKPFSVNDEWYYHMRFVDDMKGVTPVLSAIADPKTITSRWDGKKDGSHNGNKGALDDVQAGKAQHLAWAYVRPDGGRGFGFTGYHNYSNLQDDSFRTLLLNAAAWTAKLDVPSTGVPSQPLAKDELDRLYEESLRYRK
jgi:hypothetical protein